MLLTVVVFELAVSNGEGEGLRNAAGISLINTSLDLKKLAVLLINLGTESMVTSLIVDYA